MKAVLGWTTSIAVTLAAPGAIAQRLAPDETPPRVIRSSDVGGPYAAVPAPNARSEGPIMVPPGELVRMLRSTGYSVLSPPRLRGVVYSIGIINPDGDDGRLFIDARNGRKLRFVPAYAVTSRTDDEMEAIYGAPAQVAAPPITDLRRAPRPPAGVPKVANRSPATPTPPARPARAVAEPTAAPVQPAQPPQSQSVATTPTTTGSAARAAAPAEARPLEQKPSAVILPTQEMPAALGLD